MKEVSKRDRYFENYPSYTRVKERVVVWVVTYRINGGGVGEAAFYE